MRFGLLLAVILTTAVTAGAANSAAAPLRLPGSSVLYDSALRCPTGSCHGRAYDARIYVIPKPGYPARSLTSGAFNDTNPVWSPNRRRIAFFRGGSTASAKTTLWLMNADGTGQKQLSSTPVQRARFDSTSWLGGSGGPAWSANGKEIAFIGVSPSYGDLYTINADGTGLADVTAGKPPLEKDAAGIGARFPNWSKDGTKIAFSTVYGEFPSILTIAPAGTGITLLLTHANQETWSPDGTEFAFVRSVGGGHDAIYTSTATGANEVELTPTSDNFEPSWSPDGTQIAFVRANQITVMNADGSHIKQISRHDPTHFVENPDW